MSTNASAPKRRTTKSKPAKAANRELPSVIPASRFDEIPADEAAFEPAAAEPAEPTKLDIRGIDTWDLGAVLVAADVAEQLSARIHAVIKTHVDRADAQLASARARIGQPVDGRIAQIADLSYTGAGESATAPRQPRAKRGKKAARKAKPAELDAAVASKVKTLLGKGGEHRTSEIAARIGRTPAEVKAALDAMREAGSVKKIGKQGPHVRYKAA